jgi:hypothetical protein
MKKTLIVMMLVASTSAFADESKQYKCGGQVYDPAEWECVGNNTLKELESKSAWDAMGEGVNQIGGAISDGASAAGDAISGAAKKLKFW